MFLRPAAALLGVVVVSLVGLAQVAQDSERGAAIKRATEAVRSATALAASDPDRPAFHFHAPAQWINDPNGPIFYKGWYHLFYQFNPYGDQWDHMHWGHARSRDLLHWEDLPVALWPSESLGEHHVYSGSTYLDRDGEPIALYTSIGAPEPEQWGARPQDDEMVTWSKIPHVLRQADNGGEPIAEWRDPFMFELDGATHLLVGGGRHGRGGVFLYRAARPDLTAWKYEGEFFSDPDSDVPNIECPNIVRVDNHWVLFISVHGRVEWFTGDIAGGNFSPVKRGIAYSGSYASQIYQHTHGRALYTAWVPTQDHKGWNGFHTLPAELHVSGGGTLEISPCHELRTLRKQEFTEAKGLDSGANRLSADGDQLEVEFTVEPGGSDPVELRLRGGSLVVTYDPRTRELSAQGKSAVVSGDGKLHLDVFLDRTVVDVFASDGTAVCGRATHVASDQTSVELVLPAGNAHVSGLRSWSLSL
jgi:beta-fructofuranosidase